MNAMSATTLPIEVPVRPRLYIAGGTDVDQRCGAAGKLVVTRRGRLTLTVSTLVAVAFALVMGWSVIATAGASTQVVVQPGQTLSEIAASELPNLRLDRAIVEVQLANQMNTVQVQAGQTLTIP